MRIRPLLTLILAAQAAGLAQLTLEQKLTDFRQLAGLFNKRYAPYEWKKQNFQFDLLDSRPWLDRVASTRTDLDYYEICVDYVASLHDANARFFLPSSFRARLGFSVEVIEGRAFVTSVDRRLLPARDYPFDPGDELLSLDGKPADEWLDALGKYVMQSSLRATLHAAAAILTDRAQSSIPHAADVGDRATVVLRRISGAVETYSIPWTRTGVPLSAEGPVPGPKVNALPHADAPAPSGALLPPYTLPAGFTQRLGRSQADAFFSGTYPAAGRTLGFLRIGGSVPNTTAALAQLDTEIAYLQQSTDGLIVDDWAARNLGPCYAEDLAARFVSAPFETIGYELRATRDFIALFDSTVSALTAQGAPQSLIDVYQFYLDIVTTAYQENRGLTGAIPLCGPFPTRVPATTAYTKPLVILINEFSSGPAEFFAAMLQDAGRGVLFGAPTAASGSVGTIYNSGSYGEDAAMVSVALAVRPKRVTAPGFPATNLIEDVGVQPDVLHDVFTIDNLRQFGVPYVTAFTGALLSRIDGK